MNIDLTQLHNNSINEINISNTYKIGKDYYEKTDIIDLDTIIVDGIITEKENEDGDLSDYIKCTIKGTMIIPDSISLESIEYPFNIEFDDFIDFIYKKNENTLDIFQFLWENIVLEVPLQFTKVEDLSKFHGDGWRLISEDELINRNNPFCDLLKDLSEEE